jgi:hypothetical protein
MACSIAQNDYAAYDGHFVSYPARQEKSLVKPDVDICLHGHFPFLTG